MLSKRLLAISEMVEKNRVAYDVGCDHGLLPCFLVRNGFSPKAYASDIAEGPLAKAKENIHHHKLDGLVIPILADGLSLVPNDVETVIIAGMGVHTIISILDAANLSSFKQIICAPNKDMSILRRYLSSRHLTIRDERVVHDRFFYEIIVFDTSYHDSYSEKEIKYGPINLARRDEIFMDYLKFKRDKLVKINLKAHKMEYESAINELGSLIE